MPKVLDTGGSIYKDSHNCFSLLEDSYLEKFKKILNTNLPKFILYFV